MDWEEIGKKWLRGEVTIKEFNGFHFNPKQIEFINARKNEELVCGGFRSGKTIALMAKLWLLCHFFPGSRILLGRKSLSDIESATLPALKDVFPAGSYTHHIGRRTIEFPNGSEIYLYGLDVLVSGDDTGKAAQKIKGLTLSAVFIDQLEEIQWMMFEQLIPRISHRTIPYQPFCATTNPANFWAYDYFKVQPEVNPKLKKRRLLLETGMEDNRQHLPEGYIENLMETKSENFIKRFVLGEWTPDTFTEGSVFEEQFINSMPVRAPIKTVDGIKIFVEPKDHEYQIGVDPSLGSKDPGHICVVDKSTGETVATYSGYVNTDVLVDRTVRLANMYSLKKLPRVVPERTGVGQSFVDQLKRKYDNIYLERRVNTIAKKRVTEKLGWNTSYSSKLQLIDSFKVLLEKRFPKIMDEETIKEFRLFQYTDEASQKGAGAPVGFHDDRVMATLLAYWELEPTHDEKNFIHEELKRIQKQNRKMKSVSNSAR